MERAADICVVYEGYVQYHDINSSAVVEALFNKYSYAKNRFRSSMLDGTAASILSTQELEDLIGNVKKPFAAFFELRSVALTDKLNWT